MHPILATQRVPILASDTIKIEGKYTLGIYFEPFQGVVESAGHICTSNLRARNSIPGFDKSRIPTEARSVKGTDDKSIHEAIKRADKVWHFKQLRIRGKTLRDLIYGRVREGEQRNTLALLSISAMMKARDDGPSLAGARTRFNEAAAVRERQLTLRI